MNLHHGDNIPNALLIGAQKAGTTSLFDWISQHPQVLSSQAIKDFPYFWHDTNYSKGINELTKHLPLKTNEKIILAGNVNDLFFDVSAERIHALSPEMKLIICLRNPIERAESAYRHALERGFEKRTFREAIQEELSGKRYINLLDQVAKDYIAHGNYGEQIARYLNLFGRDQLHVVLFEDLKQQPELVVRGIFQFLAIDDEFSPKFFRRNETKGGARLSSINLFIYNKGIRQPWWYRHLKKIINRDARSKIRDALDKINLKKTRVFEVRSPETENLLREYYAADIKLLSSLLNRDFSGWLA